MEQQQLFEALAFLKQYEGRFNFLVDLKKRAADPTYQLTERQVNAVLRCKKKDQRWADDGRQADAQHGQAVELGVYKVVRSEDDFNIYRVQLTRDKKRRYAKKLVPISGWRKNEEGDRVQWEWEYAPGVIGALRPEHRMNEEDAKQFGLKYRICANCGRGLKQADSVERGIGPVCVKYFRF